MVESVCTFVQHAKGRRFVFRCQMAWAWLVREPWTTGVNYPHPHPPLLPRFAAEWCGQGANPLQPLPSPRQQPLTTRTVERSSEPRATFPESFALVPQHFFRFFLQHLCGGAGGRWGERGRHRLVTSWSACFDFRQRGDGSSGRADADMDRGGR